MLLRKAVLSLLLTFLTLYPKQFPGSFLTNEGKAYLAFEYPDPAIDVTQALRLYVEYTNLAPTMEGMYSNQIQYLSNEIQLRDLQVQSTKAKCRKKSFTAFGLGSIVSFVLIGLIAIF